MEEEFAEQKSHTLHKHQKVNKKNSILKEKNKQMLLDNDEDDEGEKVVSSEKKRKTRESGKGSQKIAQSLTFYRFCIIALVIRKIS